MICAGNVYGVWSKPVSFFMQYSNCKLNVIGFERHGRRGIDEITVAEMIVFVTECN